MQTNDFKVINKIPLGIKPEHILCKIQAKEIHITRVGATEWGVLTQDLCKGDQVIVLSDPNDIGYFRFNTRYEDLSNSEEDVWSPITFDEVHPDLKSVFMLMDI